MWLSVILAPRIRELRDRDMHSKQLRVDPTPTAGDKKRSAPNNNVYSCHRLWTRGTGKSSIRPSEVVFTYEPEQ